MPSRSVQLSACVRALCVTAGMVALVTLALLLAERDPATAAGPRGCAHSNVRAARASAAEMDSAVVCLINQERTERGLPPLTVDRRLSRSAQSWTRTMVRTGDYTEGTEASFASRITRAGYPWQTAGEVIATGFPTPRAVVNAWMATTWHCRNILTPAYRNLGAGEIPVPIDGASRPATWTVDMGLVVGRSRASRNLAPMDGCPYR